MSVEIRTDGSESSGSFVAPDRGGTRAGSRCGADKRPAWVLLRGALLELVVALERDQHGAHLVALGEYDLLELAVLE